MIEYKKLKRSENIKNEVKTEKYIFPILIPSTLFKHFVK